LSQKINVSKSFYNDSLSFTELSKESAGKWAPQYGNVYQKGALISACLDLYLLQLSNAQYHLKDLKHDLGIKYGKDSYFEDDSLFNIITALTFPEVRNFFATYVEGTTPLPYEKFFGLAGVEYIPEEKYKDFTLGAVSLVPNKEGTLVIATKNMNDFGKKLGYKEGDELVSINDSIANTSNIDELIAHFYSTMHEGDPFVIKVNRKNAAGQKETVTLTAPSEKIEKTRKYLLRFSSNPTAEQLKIRNAWLNLK